MSKLDGLTPEQKANREKWCQALESGEFKQGKVFLCDNEQYCCMGVLGRILGVLSEPGRDGIRSFVGNDESLVGVLPTNVLNEAVGHGWPSTYYAWNDRDGLSFKEIAAKIRAGEDLR